MAGSAVIGALRVTLGLDTAQYETGLKKAQSQMADAGKRIQAVGAGMAKVGAGLSVAVTAPLVALGMKSLQAAAEVRDAAGQVQAALTGMGNAAGRTMPQLQAQATALMHLSTFDDDDILRKVTANMLTFGNVAGVNFDKAQVAVVDLATRMHTDLQSAAIMVGKALNVPAKGLKALQRVGIQFTEQQQDQIKAMTEAGNVAGAQAIMLGELNRQFGGSAAAAQAADHMDSARDAYNDFMETVGALIDKVLPPLTNFLTTVLNGFNNLSPGMQQAVVIGGALAAALGPVLTVLGGLVTVGGAVVTGLAPLFASGGLLAGIIPLLGPIGIAIAAAGAVFFLFKDQIISALQEAWATISDVLGPKMQPLFSAAMDLFKAAGDLIAKVFAPGSPASLQLAVWGELIKRVFNAAVQVVGGIVSTLTEVFSAIAALLRGDWAGAWTHAAGAVSAFATATLNVFRALFPGVIEWVQKTYEGVKQWLGDRFEAVVRDIEKKVGLVIGFFHNMWDVLVGHSIVPDTINAIAEWFAKLDAAMVAPVKGAKDKVQAHFEDMRNRLQSTLEGLLTDQERAIREFNDRMAAISWGEQRGPGSGGIDAAAANQARARARAALDAATAPKITLDTSAAYTPSDLSTQGRDDFVKQIEGMKEAADKAKEAMADSFGKAFSEGVRGALHGDLKSVFANWVNQGLDSLLNNIGKSLFNALSSIGGSGGGGGGFWGGLFNAVGSIFSKSPGFATGGGFTVGGSGGHDSQLRALRLTPGEKVSVTRPDQDGPWGQQARQDVHVHVTPSPYFDARVQQVTTPMVQKMGAAVLQQAPSRQASYNLLGS